MHKLVAMADLYPMISETLTAGGCVSLTSTGVSMLPMLRDRRDTVVLEPADRPPRVSDVVLYRRENGQFVLHRIVGLDRDGSYVLCGDHQWEQEHGIMPGQVIGRLKAFTRKGRYITCKALGYKVYVWLLPGLRLFLRTNAFARRVMRRLKHLAIKQLKPDPKGSAKGKK